ncbi:MAG TPA: DUF4080 domain-containing protein [Gammaproteobacteria bacterium]
MSDIVLATLNARYIHASLGLRYLLANLGELRPRATLREFTINEHSADIAERLLAEQPRIIGLGLYIWNVVQTTEVAALIKTAAPDTIIVLGGPEASHEPESLPTAQWADYLIAGPGEHTFRELCLQLLAGERPDHKLITATAPELATLVLPYREYSDEDVAHRIIYVEASRGCPFRCEFCLSALDKTAKPFPLDQFLEELDLLYRRGVRHFKFVDRTFNLNAQVGTRILDFFLARLDERLFLHFEVIPDHLPDPLKERLAHFPAGTLQLEIGVQSFNTVVQQLINRKQDNSRSEANLRWLRQHTHAHLHADLIAGLPGEDMASFVAGFDRLVALRPHEIQVGILKRLRGAPIARHTQSYQLRFSPYPPYEILATDRITFADMRRLVRFARYWDLIGNSGRFTATLPLLLGEHPFHRFMAFSDWLYATAQQTHRFALERLYDFVQQGMVKVLALPAEQVNPALSSDYRRSGLKALPPWLIPSQPAIRLESSPASHAQRQARHHL